MWSAHMRGILLPLRRKVPLCGGVARFARRGGHCAPPPVVLRTTPPALEPPTQTMFARGPVGGGHSDISLFGHTLPCHCEGVRSTLKTLSYDCGNPVQYVCGRNARSAFYLLDRHALLAMTMESKCIFLNSLTTPGCAHPSNGGELGLRPIAK